MQHSRRRGHDGRVTSGHRTARAFNKEGVGMYQSPKVERFGTLRELTQGKSDPGFDLSVGIGQDANQPVGCTANAAPGSAAACIGARS